MPIAKSPHIKPIINVMQLIGHAAEQSGCEHHVSQCTFVVFGVLNESFDN